MDPAYLTEKNEEVDDAQAKQGLMMFIAVAQRLKGDRLTVGKYLQESKSILSVQILGLNNNLSMSVKARLEVTQLS